MCLKTWQIFKNIPVVVRVAGFIGVFSFSYTLCKSHLPLSFVGVGLDFNSPFKVSCVSVCVQDGGNFPASGPLSRPFVSIRISDNSKLKRKGLGVSIAYQKTFWPSFPFFHTLYFSSGQLILLVGIAFIKSEIELVVYPLSWAKEFASIENKRSTPMVLPRAKKMIPKVHHSFFAWTEKSHQQSLNSRLSI